MGPIRTHGHVGRRDVTKNGARYPCVGVELVSEKDGGLFETYLVPTFCRDSSRCNVFRMPATIYLPNARSLKEINAHPQPFRSS